MQFIQDGWQIKIYFIYILFFEYLIHYQIECLCPLNDDDIHSLNVEHMLQWYPLPFLIRIVSSLL